MKEVQLPEHIFASVEEPAAGEPVKDEGEESKAKEEINYHRFFGNYHRFFGKFSEIESEKHFLDYC